MDSRAGGQDCCPGSPFGYWWPCNRRATCDSKHETIQL